MRTFFVLGMLLFPLFAASQSASVELLDVTIRVGMSESDVRRMLPTDSLHEIHGPPGARQEYSVSSRDPELSDSERWESGGMITFNEGKVDQAIDNLVTMQDASAHEALIKMHDLIAQFADGRHVCVMTQQQGRPQATTFFVFPERTLIVYTLRRQVDSTDHVAFQIGLHGRDYYRDRCV